MEPNFVSLSNEGFCLQSPSEMNCCSKSISLMINPDATVKPHLVTEKRSHGLLFHKDSIFLLSCHIEWHFLVFLMHQMIHILPEKVKG